MGLYLSSIQLVHLLILTYLLNRATGKTNLFQANEQNCKMNLHYRVQMLNSSETLAAEDSSFQFEQNAENVIAY